MSCVMQLHVEMRNWKLNCMGCVLKNLKSHIGNYTEAFCFTCWTLKAVNLETISSLLVVGTR